MTITPAIEGPRKPIKGADHKLPVVHWKLAPGGAWRMEVYGPPEDVQITEDMARKAEYTFCTQSIKGVPAALFALDGREYAQPMAPLPTTRGRRGKRKEIAPRRDAPGVAPEAPGSREEVKNDNTIQGPLEDAAVRRHTEGSKRRPTTRVRAPISLEPL